MDVYLLVGSLLTLAAVLSTRLTQHFGVPALVLFVVIGMLAGSGGPTASSSPTTGSASSSA